MLSLGLYAQSGNCSSFKSGKFTSTYEGRIAIIERNGSIQNEYLTNSKDSLKMSFNINWLDDCTYTLTPTKESYLKYPKLPRNAVITIKILNVSSNSYTQSSTSNFNSKVIISKVVRL